jgi:PAS domain S-box-containing protein
VGQLIQKPDQYEILVVDDRPENLKLLSRMLKAHGYRVRQTTDARHAMKSVAAKLPDLILLDVKMPTMDGFEVCRRLKSDQHSRNVPVVFISALGETAQKVRGFKAGGVDYITKPFEAEEVLARVGIHLHLHELSEQLEQMVIERTAALHSANAKLERIMASISDCLWSAEVDQEGNWTYGYYSPVVEKITGHPPAFYKGHPKRWLNTIHQDDRPRLLKTFERIMNKQSEREEEEYRLIRSDGTVRWLRDCAVITQLETHQQIYRVISDITERKQAEEKIHKLNQELEQRVHDRTTQLEAANREMHAFTYAVSHDLRAPLRHIDGFVELLLKKTVSSLDKKGRHYMAAISDAAQKMGRLIDELLAFSQMGRYAPSFQKVALAELVRDVVDQFEPETQGRKIDWRIDALPAVSGDAAMLRIVLVSLISNALKFTRSRATAQIEIGSHPGDDAETVVFVRDNGVGFDMTYANKLFGVFQRLHRSEEFEGTGIGLATVQRIVALHGGRTWAEGDPEQGAAFYIALPCA